MATTGDSQHKPPRAGSGVRPQGEEAPHRVCQALDRRVQERTAALLNANQALQAEVAEYQQAAQIARGQREALAKTLILLAAEPELDRFVGQVLEAITEQLGAHSGDFWLYDKSSDSTYLHIEYDKGQILPAVSSKRPESSRTRRRETPKALHSRVESCRDQPFRIYENIAHAPLPKHDRDHLLAKGIQTLLRVPLFLGEEFLGSFSIHSTHTRTYQPEEIELAQALAQQAVLALHLTRLAEQSRQAAVLEERNRIAQEIHDTLAQAFTGILIELGVAQRIAKQRPEEAWGLIEHVRDLAHQGLAAARRSVWALQPQALEYSNLALTLARTVEQMTSSTPVRADMSVQGTARALPPEVGMHLLRIGQEALSNALRHAQARKVRIELRFEAEHVRLRVQDDGHGFDPRPQAEGGGFGLIGMRQRAERLGGQLRIATQPGQGTEVTVIVPMAAAP